MAEAEYSFSLTTFSPSGKSDVVRLQPMIKNRWECGQIQPHKNTNIGKLMQIEHALQTVSRGDPSLGIKAKNGVVILWKSLHMKTTCDTSNNASIRTE